MPDHVTFAHQGFGKKGRDTLVVECSCSTVPLGVAKGDAKTRRETADRLRAAHERENR